VTTIVVQVTTTDTPLPDGVQFAATAIVVTDNSGAVLPAVTLDGSETPPWSATLTGATGPQEASVVVTALDTNGNTLATLTGTETGTGGQPGTFPSPTGVSITVS
jgi:Rieske Fe-S protein